MICVPGGETLTKFYCVCAQEEAAAKKAAEVVEAVVAQEQGAVTDLKRRAAEADAEVKEMQKAAKSHHDDGKPIYTCLLTAVHHYPPRVYTWFEAHSQHSMVIDRDSWLSSPMKGQASGLQRILTNGATVYQLNIAAHLCQRMW